MKIKVILMVLTLAWTLGGAMADEPLRLLILSGQNNHKWQETTPALKQIFESTGQFVVEVTERPDQIDPASLQKFNVIVSNWNTYAPKATVTEWPEALKTALLDWVKAGNGFVVVHAGGSSFLDWEEYQKLIGATWDKKAGTGHGPRHSFEVKIVDPKHPITAGMSNFTTNDELWHRMGVNGEIHVLAEAFSESQFKGTEKNEPMAFVTDYGKGHCFNLVLGHDVAAMSTQGFKDLLIRGTLWSAGKLP